MDMDKLNYLLFSGKIFFILDKEKYKAQNHFWDLFDSEKKMQNLFKIFIKKWRREWDSNP